MVLSSSFVLLFVASLLILTTAQFSTCNICSLPNRTISKPGLLIVTAQLSSTKGNWTCREIDEAGKAGSFNTGECRSAIFLGNLYCGCLGSPISPTPIISSPICELCGRNQFITYPKKTLNTAAGILSCSVICPQLNRSRIIQECGCVDPPPTSSPTSSPTSKPTPLPTGGPSISAMPVVANFCLSGENVAHVQNKGILHVKDLKIGDMVSIGNDKFSRVYSFGHRQNHTVADYLQIHVKGTQYPLEITEQHMVFVDQRGAVPASTVMVGDKLVVMSAQNGSSTTAAAAVTHVLHVRRVGAYAPFTESGSLMVSDVLTSSYISMQKHDSQSFSVLAGVVEIASMQWLAHASQAPHRMVCRLNRVFCDTEEYTEDGISHWVYGPFFAADWLMNQNVVVMMFLAPPVALLLVVFFSIESIVQNITLFTVVLIGTLAIVSRSVSKTKSD